MYIGALSPGAIVCNCPTPTHLRDNLLSVPVGCI